MEAHADREALPETVAQGVGEVDGVLHAQGVALAVRLALPEAQGEGEVDRVGEAEAVADAEGSAVALAVPHGVGERVAVALGVVL